MSDTGNCIRSDGQCPLFACSSAGHCIRSEPPGVEQTLRDEASAPITKATELIKALRAALRKTAIRDFVFAQVGCQSCHLCENGSWEYGEPERHAEGCLAEPPLPESPAPKSTVAPSGLGERSPDGMLWSHPAPDAAAPAQISPSKTMTVGVQQTPLPVERDAARLDWIERNHADIMYWCRGNSLDSIEVEFMRRSKAGHDCPVTSGKHSTLRAAIDAAIYRIAGRGA